MFPEQVFLIEQNQCSSEDFLLTSFLLSLIDNFLKYQACISEKWSIVYQSLPIYKMK